MERNKKPPMKIDIVWNEEHFHEHIIKLGEALGRMAAYEEDARGEEERRQMRQATIPQQRKVKPKVQS